MLIIDFNSNMHATTLKKITNCIEDKVGICKAFLKQVKASRKLVVGYGLFGENPLCLRWKAFMKKVKALRKWVVDNSSPEPWLSQFKISCGTHAVVENLILLNEAVFLIWQVADPEFMRCRISRLKLHLIIIDISELGANLGNFRSGRLHTMITSGFSHFEADHIVGNMICFYFHGKKFGPKFLLKLYLAGAIAGSSFFLLEHASIKHQKCGMWLLDKEELGDASFIQDLRNHIDEWIILILIMLLERQRLTQQSKGYQLGYCKSTVAGMLHLNSQNYNARQQKVNRSLAADDAKEAAAAVSLSFENLIENMVSDLAIWAEGFAYPRSDYFMFTNTPPMVLMDNFTLRANGRDCFYDRKTYMPYTRWTFLVFLNIIRKGSMKLGRLTKPVAVDVNMKCRAKGPLPLAIITRVLSSPGFEKHDSSGWIRRFRDTNAGSKCRSDRYRVA
ncbi:rhomboid-related intramembrane serine protease family protein [Artemisia annua]|uniref:Rhomboid-related intramembrane serine protease family protein n=1 Tax=Artemisia annua TaxID=35608 RepID=A0A2U1LD53_ARTAN|nr:rhomboid-related intramembrane serine protease family protein [Artemisia annua]